MRILVVAAHPDDEVLGCGGTISRLVREGHEVLVHILGEGITSRMKRREECNEGPLAALQEQAREAGRVLGVKSVAFSKLPDNRFDTVALLDIVKLVECTVQEFRPSRIYTHAGIDLNIDHRLTHQAVLTATRPTPGCLVSAVYGFEVMSSTEWAFDAVFRPTVFVALRQQDVLAKQEALRMYSSEIRGFPHPRSLEAITARAAWWGSAVGVEAAEAFELVRSVE